MSANPGQSGLVNETIDGTITVSGTAALSGTTTISGTANVTGSLTSSNAPVIKNPTTALATYPKIIGLMTTPTTTGTIAAVGANPLISTNGGVLAPAAVHGKTQDGFPIPVAILNQVGKIIRVRVIGNVTAGGAAATVVLKMDTTSATGGAAIVTLVTATLGTMSAAAATFDCTFILTTVSGTSINAIATANVTNTGGVVIATASATGVATAAADITNIHTSEAITPILSISVTNAGGSALTIDHAIVEVLN